MQKTATQFPLLQVKIKDKDILLMLSPQHNIFAPRTGNQSLFPANYMVTCFLPKLPALSCHHPLLPLSSWLQNIKRRSMSYKWESWQNPATAQEEQSPCHQPNQQGRHQMLLEDVWNVTSGLLQLNQRYLLKIHHGLNFLKSPLKMRKISRKNANTNESMCTPVVPAVCHKHHAIQQDTLSLQI